MSNKVQSILASRLASTTLALVIFAGFTVPFVLLQSTHVFAATPPVPCTQDNNNGCTELSSTPPEDTVTVPPNIVLMFDDSGSMAWDYMPDVGPYLESSSAAMIDASNNQVYYNPKVIYTSPPQANGTSYAIQNDMANVPVDAFGVSTKAKINLFQYDASKDTGEVHYSTAPALNSYKYPRNYHDSHFKLDLLTWPDKNYDFQTAAGCENWYNDFDVNRAYNPNFAYRKAYDAIHYTCTIYWSIGSVNTPPFFFRYSTGPKSGPYVVYYVAPPKPTGDCAKSPDPAHCVYADDVGTSVLGSPAPDGITVGANIATWFAYYHTRMQMAKSGLMIAFNALDSKYRFGFASINANGVSRIPSSPNPFTFDDYTYPPAGGSKSNKLAVVQPFGDGTSGTQKAKFWNWLEKESPSGNTPLRKALQGVGEYYKDAQAWSSMQGDPSYTASSTTNFACRASYTILTTDGFWNGDDPVNIGNAADEDGAIQRVPSGNVTQYKAEPPFSGGGVKGAPSLADVATYYWANDLQSGMLNEVASSTADPASWQHMTTFTVGLGFDPTGIKPNNVTIPQIFAWAHGGTAISNFSWPTPKSDNVYNVADLAHAAVNGHGDFFNVKSPGDLATAFSKVLSDISARNVAPTPAAVNASVLSAGALAFSTGYNGDWTGQLQAVTLKTDGRVSAVLWQAGALLDAAYQSPSSYVNRTVYTGAYKISGPYSSFQLTASNIASLDAVETSGLQAPSLAGGSDTVGNRINYLLGDNTYEGVTYRARPSILGAILRAEPVYVAGATGNYRDSWPTIGSLSPPEKSTDAQTYGAFVSDHAARVGIVYVGANDGMLHAFHAPVPQCTATIDINGDCAAYTFPSGSKQGKEAWAFVPRAVYANLGNLTSLTNFQFRATVDATPVARDVFFSGDKKWHTILTGGVGVGGRGVYGLDITDPTTFSATDVLWEFNADMPVDSTCVANYDTCKGTDLGYTVGQPNVGRLSNGKWVVLVPNGYFPDCSTPDSPTADNAVCKSIAAQAPKDSAGNPYGALFVLDAQTGKVIAELKTPTNLGVTGFGLAKPVMGDYDSDQVDDAAFAGDVQGNLWRFDLSSTDPSQWAVSLVYKGISDAKGHQGVQPITTMPRLFPDPTTNRFLVLFGTGKYLGVGDNGTGSIQSIIAVRDMAGTAYSQADLTQQYLHETVVSGTLPDGTLPANAGSSLRCITGSTTDDDCTATTAINKITSDAGGWYVNLSTTTNGDVHSSAGERVVVNPGAIFASNTVVFESLITGAQSSDACNPSTQGAFLALNATTGGASGVSSLGGPPIAGGRISNARTSGTLPIVSALGGGKAYLPGVTLAPSGDPISIDAPIWRRRSWRVLLNDQ